MNQSVRLAITTLGAHPLRTTLSTLGIIIGVAALVSVLSIGDGIEKYARSQIEGTTDLQTIVVGPVLFDHVGGAAVPKSNYPIFSQADADSLAARVGGYASVAATLQGGSRVKVGSETRLVQLVATGPAYRERQIPTLKAGRFISRADVDAGARVVVLSDALGQGASIGDSIVLEKTAYRIVGVLNAPESGTAPMAAIVPFTAGNAALAPSTMPQAPHLLVRAQRIEWVDSVQKKCEQWLGSRFGNWKDVAKAEYSRGLRLKQAQQGMLIFKLAVGSFAGITLIVGGIGIMNILLAAVAERTREIGVRKAIGASNRAVLQQFLGESIAVCAAGAFIGTVVGLATAFGVTAILRHASGAIIYAAFSWSTVAIAAATSIAVGLAFGAYPAIAASRLSPIEAIRHD